MRKTANPKNETILFIVGMRINKLWAIHRWFPVFSSMPKMLREQLKDRSLGMIGEPRTYISGRLIQVQQYWKDFESLEKYAKKANLNHYPNWKKFNKRSKNNDAVGIYHETYIINKGNYENIYVNIPHEILLGSSVGTSEVNNLNNSARSRIDK